MKVQLRPLVACVWLLLLLITISCVSHFCDAKSWADIAANRPEPGVVDSNSNSNNACDATGTKKRKEPPLSSSPSSPQRQKRNTPPPPQHGVYASLPSTTEKFRVQHVYDGDTLTLVDQRRVRFWGIDTPELKPVQQAFSQEAKAYAKQYCHQKEIYLDIHTSHTNKAGTDKYGRLLAEVWAQTENGNYLNVGEGLVAAGLATAYFTKEDLATSSSSSTKNSQKKLLQLQTQAREKRLGLWKEFVDRNVVVTKYGTAYHEPTCRHLAQSRNTKVLTTSKALDRGLHPCRTCLADE